MEFVAILAVGGFIAFFFYHRVIITRFERSMINFEAQLDYMEDVIQLIRLQYTELDKMVTRRSQVKKTPKKKVGRPMNPNSIRQKKLRGEN
jgi:hypothetical protein